MITNKGNRYISYGEADDCFQQSTRQEDTLVIWFDGANSKIAYNHTEESFHSEFRARQLVYLLRFTSKNNPGNEHTMQNCFVEVSNSTFVSNERLRTAVRQLRRLLNGLNPELDVISTSRSPYPNGYYYNKKVPYMIICRSEEASLLYK